MMWFEELYRTQESFVTKRAVNQWDQLPNRVVLVDSTDSFKAQLDSHWSSLGYGHMHTEVTRPINDYNLWNIIAVHIVTMQWEN